MNSPALVDEVCSHLCEMLDSGAIQPSQNAWCNAVALVRKKGWKPMLLYRLPLPQCLYEERLLPLAKNSRGVRESGRSWSFFLPGPKIGVLAN